MKLKKDKTRKLKKGAGRITKPLRKFTRAARRLVFPYGATRKKGHTDSYPSLSLNEDSLSEHSYKTAQELSEITPESSETTVESSEDIDLKEDAIVLPDKPKIKANPKKLLLVKKIIVTFNNLGNREKLFIDLKPIIKPLLIKLLGRIQGGIAASLATPQRIEEKVTSVGFLRQMLIMASIAENEEEFTNRFSDVVMKYLLKLNEITNIIGEYNVETFIEFLNKNHSNLDTIMSEYFTNVDFDKNESNIDDEMVNSTINNLYSKLDKDDKLSNNLFLTLAESLDIQLKIPETSGGNKTRKHKKRKHKTLRKYKKNTIKNKKFL